MTNDDWFSSAHVPPAQRLEPVTLGEPLWRLTKDGHTAEARVRAIDGIGLELRYEWNGDLRASQVFKTWAELDQAADEKRRGERMGVMERVYERKHPHRNGSIVTAVTQHEGGNCSVSVMPINTYRLSGTNARSRAKSGRGH